MGPKDNNTEIELNGIEVVGDDPVHLDSRFDSSASDIDTDEAGFDEGVDMRNLADEGSDNDADTGDTGVGAEGDADSDASDAGDGDRDAAEKVDAPVDLGEFKADDSESVETFTKQYYSDGVLNLPTLYAEFEKNFSEGNSRLNAGTEAFLASRGIPKEALENHYEAYNLRVAEAKRTYAEQDAALTELAGGKDAYETAVKWATQSGTYSEAAREAFNKTMRGTDFEAKKDAVELLLVRYGKANPKKERDEPLRDATKGKGKSTGAAVKPFKDRAEYAAARKAAGDDMAKLRIVDARARAGGF